MHAFGAQMCTCRDQICPEHAYAPYPPDRDMVSGGEGGNSLWPAKKWLVVVGGLCSVQHQRLHPPASASCSHAFLSREGGLLQLSCPVTFIAGNHEEHEQTCSNLGPLKVMQRGHPVLLAVWKMSDEIWHLMWPVRDEMWSFMGWEMWKCENGGGWEGYVTQQAKGLSRLVSPSQELSSSGHQRTNFLLQHNSSRHQKFVKRRGFPRLPLAIST